MSLLWLVPSQGNPVLGGPYGLSPEWWGRASYDNLSKNLQAEAKVSAKTRRPELALPVSGVKASAVSGVQWEGRRSEPLGPPRPWGQVCIIFQGLRSYWRVWSRKGPVLIRLSERVEGQIIYEATAVVQVVIMVGESRGRGGDRICRWGQWHFPVAGRWGVRETEVSTVTQVFGLGYWLSMGTVYRNRSIALWLNPWAMYSNGLGWNLDLPAFVERDQISTCFIGSEDWMS